MTTSSKLPNCDHGVPLFLIKPRTIAFLFTSVVMVEMKKSTQLKSKMWRFSFKPRSHSLQPGTGLLLGDPLVQKLTAAVDPFTAWLSMCDIYVLIFIITLNLEQLAFHWMNETMISPHSPPINHWHKFNEERQTVIEMFVFSSQAVIMCILGIWVNRSGKNGKLIFRKSREPHGYIIMSTKTRLQINIFSVTGSTALKVNFSLGLNLCNTRQSYKSLI